LRKLFFKRFLQPNSAMMVCLVTGDAEQLTALRQAAPHIDWQAVASAAEARGQQADAYFYLLDDASMDSWEGFSCPVLVNAVLGGMPVNETDGAVGINGWPYFLEKPSWEVAGNIGPATAAVLQALGKTAIPAPCQPGLLSVRVIAMIINEAYFALGDEVSSRADIDTAMKLGTNYPYGPFEWATLLGLRRIYWLLEVLSTSDGRCTPAPLLKKEALA
jgi:3-hydroxybutyryl-CoA dehydrogenase